MKPIESAEEFALELADHCEAEYPESGLDCDLPAMASLIEADRRAVRLALLDELMERAVEFSDSQSSYGTYTRYGLEKAYHRLWDKYGKP